MKFPKKKPYLTPKKLEPSPRVQKPTEAYPDGSLNKETNNTTDDVVLPTWYIEEVGSLAEGNSKFTAETFGILRAMAMVYSHEEYVTELAILICFFLFSYLFLSVLMKSLDGPIKNNHLIIEKIIKTSQNLKVVPQPHRCQAMKEQTPWRKNRAL